MPTLYAFYSMGEDGTTRLRLNTWLFQMDRMVFEAGRLAASGSNLWCNKPQLRPSSTSIGEVPHLLSSVGSYEILRVRDALPKSHPVGVDLSRWRMGMSSIVAAMMSQLLMRLKL